MAKQIFSLSFTYSQKGDEFRKDKKGSGGSEGRSVSYVHGNLGSFKSSSSLREVWTKYSVRSRYQDSGGSKIKIRDDSEGL